jgi:predicted Zn-dependent protease
MSESRSLQVERLLEVKRHAEARRVLGEWAAETPDDPDMHVNLARVAFAEEDREAARQHVADTLRYAPKHFGARLLLYHLQYVAGDFHEAEATLIELLRDHPTSSHLISIYAQLMLRSGHVDKARALNQEALRLDPGSEHARLVQVLLATLDGRASDANAILAELIAEDPEAFDLTAHLYDALMQQHRYREALEVGRQLVRADPTNQELIETVAEARLRTHWFALPAYPFYRWGWKFSAMAWLGAMLLLRAPGSRASSWLAYFAAAYFAWVLHSWIHAPILRHVLLKRGF